MIKKLIFFFKKIPRRTFRLLRLLNALFKILEFNIVPSHLGKKTSKFKSNIHATNTFLLDSPFDNDSLGVSSRGTFTRMCIPSIAPM